MKSMIKIMPLVVLLALLMPGIHGDAYSVYVADSEDLSAYIFESPINPDVLTINDPYHYTSNNTLELVSAQNSARSQYIPYFTANGIYYEFETFVETQGYEKVPAYTTVEELTPERIEGYISTAQLYPGVEILGNPTEDYNCHSYAWYMESTENPYWIINIEIYAYDVHTVWRETTEIPQPGDICVYLQNGLMVHSAVVVSSDGDTTICRSKWGPSVLCEHPIGSVPDEYLDVDKVLRYYVMTITPHEWNYEFSDTNQHTRTCSICGYEVTENCDYTYTYFQDDMHNASCKYCDNGYAGAFCTFTYTSNGNGTHTRSCNGCSNTYTESCDLEYTNLTNTRHSVACTVCDYSVNSQLCTLTYTSNGNKTHTVSCSSCGNDRTVACSIVSEYASSNQHFNGCTKCGAGSLANCVAVYTYCGNASLGDVHKQTCKTCGHAMSSGTQTCTFAYKYNGQVDGSNTHVYACTVCDHIDSGPTLCTYIGTKPCLKCGSVKGQVSVNTSEEELAA